MHSLTHQNASAKATLLQRITTQVDWA